MTAAAVARLRIAALLIVGLVVQTTFGADLRVYGVSPDIMLLLAITGGLIGGAEAGAVVGFASGLLADLSLSTTPLGLCALSWCLVGWGVGTMRANVLPEGRTILPVIAAVGTAGGVVVFLLIGDLVGQSQLIGLGRAYLLRATVLESLWAALLAVPVGWIYDRAARGTAGAVELRRPEAVSSR